MTEDAAEVFKNPHTDKPVKTNSEPPYFMWEKIIPIIRRLERAIVRA